MALAPMVLLVGCSTVGTRQAGIDNFAVVEKGPRGICRGAQPSSAGYATLKSRGAEFIGPEKGMLSCGYEGIGRLWPVEKIAARVSELAR